MIGPVEGLRRWVCHRSGTVDLWQHSSMKLRPALAVVIAVLAVGCSGDGDERIGLAGFVAAGQSDAPEGCQPVDVGRLIVGFFEAFNSGNVAARVDEFVAPAGSFGWFSVQGVGERLNNDASDRASLSSYLQLRADAGEKLRLVAMDTAYERARNVAHIAYNVQRSAPDGLEGTAVVVGKGAIDCESGKITVWSMGTADGGPLRLCPSAAPPPEQDVAIVCVRVSQETPCCAS